MNSQADFQFRKDRLEKLRNIERHHFWFRGRLALFRRFLGIYSAGGGSHFLDLGCGTGRNMEWIREEDHRVSGTDGRIEGLLAARQSFHDTPVFQSDFNSRLPIQDCSFDAVLSLDVLEHVEDKPLLREIHRVLSPGGVLYINVPAFPWLWSFRDEDAGHLRRYERRELEKTLVDAGFSIKELRYYQFLLFPLVVFGRLLGRRRTGVRDFEDRPFGFINNILWGITRLEIAIGRHVRFPFGSSLAAVCIRK